MKIKESTIFIADISFIGNCNKNKKQLPNPNVLIELGYAFATLGSDRILCVFNEDTGNVENLPFDLRHKRHLTYKLDNQDDFKSSLQSSIKNILKLEKSRDKNLTIPANPSHNQIFKIIMASDSEDNWHRVSLPNGKTITYFKENVNLKFEIDYNNGIHREEFKEPWANDHADENATSYYCNLFYANTTIEQFILVSVDRGRAMLPLPNSRNDLTVKLLRYKVAQIHDKYSVKTLDEYMVRSGLKLEDYDLAS